MNDPFDLKQLQIPPEQLEEHFAAARKREAAQLKRALGAKVGLFVKLPYERMLEVCGSLAAAVLGQTP